MPPRSSIPGGVSTDNIVEGSRKRARNDHDANANSSSSPMLSSTLTLASTNSRPGTRDQVNAQGFRLLDYVINRIDPSDKSPLCIPFLALPSRTELPDYYEQIKTPMSIEQIRRQLLARRYSSLEDVRNALETVWRNAKRYNLKGSDIYEQARILHSATRESYVDLMERNELAPANDGAPQESSPTLQDASEQLVKTETPSARARLDWDEPARGPPRVSLRLKKTDDIDYEEDNLAADESDDDMDAPAAEDHNVTTTRETRSGSSRRASEVKAEASEPADIEMADVSRGNETSDIKRTGSASFFAAAENNTPSVAGTPGDNRGDSDGENDGDLIDLKDLPGYDAVTGLLNGNPVDKSMLTLGGKFDRRKRPGPRGKRLKSSLRHQVTELKGKLRDDGKTLLCADFMQLPSQKDFPEYYRVITNPISLGMIDEKAMRNGYANPHGLITDLKLMVENAKFFNEEKSHIWTTADEIDKHIDSIIVPSLLADGFTLDPDDLRQSALPIEYAAVSTIPAHAAAYRRVRGITEGQSASPEPSAGGLHFAPQNGAAGGPMPLGGQAHIQVAGSAALPNGTNGMRPPAGMSPPRFSPASPIVLGQNTAAFRPSPSMTHQPLPYQNLPVGSPHAHVPPGNLPFQRPTHGMLGPNTPQGQASSRTLKRMTGEAPPGPYDVTTMIPLADGTHWRRTPVSPFIIVRSSSVIGGDKKKVTLLNDLTRIHAVHLGLGNDASPDIKATRKLNESVGFEFRLREVVPTAKTGRKSRGQAAETEDAFPPWKVSVSYNGRPLTITIDADEGENGISLNDAKDADVASSPASIGDGLIEVPQGSTCRFAVRPTMGSSVIDVTITPSPPDAALAAIADDETNSHSARARAFLQLPERYRIFVHRA